MINKKIKIIMKHEMVGSGRDLQDQKNINILMDIESQGTVREPASTGNSHFYIIIAIINKIYK